MYTFTAYTGYDESAIEIRFKIKYFTTSVNYPFANGNHNVCRQRFGLHFFAFFAVTATRSS